MRVASEFQLAAFLFSPPVPKQQLTMFLFSVALVWFGQALTHLNQVFKSDEVTQERAQALLKKLLDNIPQ